MNIPISVTLKIFFAVVFVAAAVIAVATYNLMRLASIAAAFKAKLLCSGVFVAKREPASLRNADMAIRDHSILRHINTRIDYSSHRITADFFGLIKRNAVFRPGLGSVLVHAAYDVPVGLAETYPSASHTAMPEEYVPAFVPALDWAFSEPDPARPRCTRAVVVMLEGVIVAERYAPGFDKDTPLLGWSMTKSVMNALTGILIKNGRLTLDAPLSVPEWRKADDRRQRITLDHLLRMTSGLRFKENYRNPLGDVTNMLFGVPDTAAYASRKPLDAEPGTKWSYSSGTTNILSRVIRQCHGPAEYPAFPRTALFRPLGMDSAVIEQDAAGTFVGSSFMYATARDWAKFGQLYLQDGTWGGVRLLPEGWVRYTMTATPQAPDGKYGALFWLKIPPEFQGGELNGLVPADAFHAVGHEGQLVSIIPSRKLVVVRLGLTRNPSQWHHDRFLGMVAESAYRHLAASRERQG